MKHPSEATLALFAGNDLGSAGRWRTRRHLAGCALCRAEVEAFTAVRAETRALDELPDISWSHLAADMKANIGVGLAAGECVEGPAPAGWLFARARVLVACASMAMLLVAGLWLERPSPSPLARSDRQEGVSLSASGNGIEVRDGEQVFGLLHGAAENVTYSVGAQGSMRARYTDPNTGYVTINTVYVQ
jgi:hypothetical protein